MTVDEAIALYARITYKPGFQIHVRHGLFDALEVTFARRVEDATGVRPGLIPLIGGSTLTYEYVERMDEAYFLREIRRMLVQFETHEMDEWFKVDGVCVNDPHPERERALARERA